MIFLKPKFWDKPAISPFSVLLFPISLIFKVLSFFRRLLTKKHQFTIPVICVGNIYLGGTGKTPLCIEIFSILKSLNMKPAFIRKKYNSFQDETKLQKIIGPIYESKKRVEAIKNAIQNKINVAILDDGFQDFSIKKDLSILCFNKKQWIGNGFVIPSGPLREELTALNRADCVVINGAKDETIEKKIFKKNSSIKIFYSKYKCLNIEEFKEKKIICFAGIGNPINFFNLLKENHINIIEKIAYPDHYNYPLAALNILIEKANENNATLLTTEKDYLRIDDEYKKKIKYLKIKSEIENKNEFVKVLKKII